MNKFLASPEFNYLLLYIVGGIATFSIPPFSIFPFFLGIGFGLYRINFKSSLIKIFLSGWFLGFGWFSFGLYWIGSAFFMADTYHVFLMPVAIILLPSLLAVFWGSACVCAKLINRNTNFSILYIIVFLSLFEYLRAQVFTGFPWLMPSMIFASNVYLIQVFSFVGSFSTNIIVLILSILPFIFFSNFKGKNALSLILLIPIAILLFCGIIRYSNKSFLQNTNQLVTIVQPNIKQKNKWILKNREQHLNNLIELSIKYQNSLNNKNRIIIWPETSFEGSIPREKKLLTNISEKILKNKNTTLILGLLRTDEKKVFNSLVFLNSNGDIIHNYDKIKLVPFGEYIPFRKYLGALTEMLAPKDFTSGKLKINPSIYAFEDIVTLICYEVLFTNEIVRRLTKNTNLLINITNDAWFGKTIGPYQHLALAKIKAVEFGLPLARVANTGVSAYISPYGETIGRIPLDNKGEKTFYQIPALNNTLYKIYGEYIFVAIIFILLVINITYIFTKGKKLNEK